MGEFISHNGRCSFCHRSTNGYSINSDEELDEIDSKHIVITSYPCGHLELMDIITRQTGQSLEELPSHDIKIERLSSTEILDTFEVT